jgi:hypothetical protein
MDGSKCILQLRGVRPFLSDKYDITKHKNYKYLSDFKGENAFNIEQFVGTKLAVKPDDKYFIFAYAAPEDEMPETAYGDFQETVPSESGEADDADTYHDDLEPL